MARRPRPDARYNRLINTIEMRQREVVLQSRPYSIQLEVTTKCNFACIMCARDKYHGTGENLEDDILKPVLRELLSYAQDIIVSSFGELLLYPGLPEIFKRIDKRSGLELGFFTNFVLMTEPMAELIIKSGVAYVNASIDGATRETYEKIRRGGKWDILTEKLDMFNAVKRRLGSSTPRLNLCVVGSTLNVREIPLFVEFAHRYGFESVKYNHNMYVDDETMDYMSLVHEKKLTNDMFRLGLQRALELGIHSNFDKPPFKSEGPVDAEPPVRRSADVSDARLAWNKFKRRFHQAIGWRIENTWKQSGKTPGNFCSLFAVKATDFLRTHIPNVKSVYRRVQTPHPIPNDAPPKTCGNPWSHVHVKSDGLVYPCCFSDEVMGDLRKQSFDDIWNGPKYQDLRRSLTSGHYWASCRRSSCNWVDGKRSSIYGAEIEVLNPPTEYDGSRGATLRVRITNTGQFRWETPATNQLCFVSLSYRLFSPKLELIDEGLHVPIPENMHPGHTVEMDLELKPVPYAGEVLLKVDLVHERVTWFGERGNSAREIKMRIVDVPFCAYVTSWRSADVRRLLEDQALRPGQEIRLPIRVTNVGTGPIGGDAFPDALSYHWQNEKGQYEEIEGRMTEITERLDPGRHVDLELLVEVPRHLRTGRYWIEIDLLRRDVDWLSQLWHRPLLMYPTRVLSHPGEEAQIPERQPNGKPYSWEPRGQCVSHTGNKGIW
jgi:radical SAM protein with 4Fe4S-binding SPASM domain